MNKRIKELRKYLGLTLEDFGKKLGVTRSAIGHIESGARNVTDQMVLSICREFNVNESWLRTGKPPIRNHDSETTLNNLIAEYGLTRKDYAFIEKLLKDHSLLSALEDFCLSYAKALAEEKENNKKSIDEQVEDYRRQLEAEEKAAEGSSVLRKDA